MNYTGIAGYYSLGALYPTLIGQDTTGKIVGDLASSWSVSADQTAWTFRLRNAGWSDGKPINAQDVVFSVTTAQAHLKDKLAGSWTSRVVKIATARAVDDHTVVLELKQPDYLMPLFIVNFWIIPQHIWSVGGATVESLDQIGNGTGPMVSGGPYSLVRRDATSAVFTANEHWSHGKVPVPGFGIKIYATDDALFLGLKSNEVDIAPSFAGVITPESLPSSIKQLGAQNLSALAIFVNLADTAHPELRSSDVRKALSLAMDREQIAKLAYGGAAMPGVSMVFSSAKPWHDETLKPDPYSVPSANSILDGLTFTRGSDGIRLANGHRMSYELIESTGTPVNAQARTLVVQQLKAIGVEVNEKQLDSAAYLAVLRQHKWALSLAMESAGSDGLFNIGLFASSGPPSASVFAQGAYDSGYRNTQYDNLYAQLQSPTVTGTLAKQLIDQMQGLLAQERPWISIVEPQVIALVRSNVSGVTPGIYGAPNIRNREEWAKIRVSQ